MSRLRPLSFIAVVLAGLGLGAATPRIARGQGEPDKKTVRLWKAKCASCHGDDGKGQTEQGRKMDAADMTTAAYWKNLADDKLRKAIAEGFKRKSKSGKDQEMKPYKDQLKPDQIDALIAYSRSFKK